MQDQDWLNTMPLSMCAAHHLEAVEFDVLKLNQLVQGPFFAKNLIIRSIA